MNEILSSAPDQMIKFKVFKRNPLTKQYNIDSRLRLVINRKKLPFGVWANLVVESILRKKRGKKQLLFLLFFTSCSLMITTVEGLLEKFNNDKLKLFYYGP